MMIAVVAATEQGIVVESVIPIAGSNTGEICVRSDNTVPDTEQQGANSSKRSNDSK
jgi:hypothetical protein